MTDEHVENAEWSPQEMVKQAEQAATRLDGVLTDMRRRRELLNEQIKATLIRRNEALRVSRALVARRRSS